MRCERMVDMNQIELDRLEKDLKNLKMELRNYTEQVENFAVDRELIVREIAIQSRFVGIIGSDNKRLQPKYEFENKPEFLANMALLDALGKEREIEKLKRDLQVIDRTVENASVEIERIKRTIPAVEEKIAKAKGE